KSRRMMRGRTNKPSMSGGGLAVGSWNVRPVAASPEVDGPDLTAEEKYQALVEKGIFDGFEDGSAGLDSFVSRAQVTKFIALILGLEPDFQSAGIYADLEGAEWAAGYIGAATAAGILTGKGNGVFDPLGTITI